MLNEEAKIENGSETIFKYISRTQCVRFDGVCSIIHIVYEMIDLVTDSL